MRSLWSDRARTCWAWYSHLNTALSAPATLGFVLAFVVPVSVYLRIEWEWALGTVAGLIALSGWVMWFLGRSRTPSQVIAIRPQVERHQRYGPHGKSRAYRITAHASSADGKVHSGARGVLTEIEPLNASVCGWYDQRDARQPGLLRWSDGYGGGATAVVTPQGADLLVLELENTDSSGRIAYADGGQRSSAKSIHLVDKWRMTVEITAADGARGECSFELSQGNRDPNNPLKIPSSPSGTLYPPVIAVLPVNGGPE